MPLPKDPEKFRRHWHAGGGPRAPPPVSPMLPGEWRPGMPSHWLEQTSFSRHKTYIIRLLSVLQLASAIAYLIFRARETVGVSPSTTGLLLAYQIFFLCLEFFVIFTVIFQLFEMWNAPKRNAIDFRHIPNNLIAPHFVHHPSCKVPLQYANYPSVGVFIPCYNEDVDLVADTVQAALNIDYPHQLLSVYLCDDGQDSLKQKMISKLRKQYQNIHYVIREFHQHAKAGNLNNALEGTTSDLVVTLDADFIARPNLLQRLIPYYYVWNPEINMYEFNETLAVVQTPQHFRNLSPYDSDPLDQRSTFFVDIVMPGKDWFNASTMIGTTNLLSRVALQESKYYPYHSITEDTAMSLEFHSHGYRTYYVNESLATGLATTTLWSNLRQRARWLKGDWQILFSRKGPFSIKGLTIVQRIMYIHMAYSRLLSIVYFIYDIAIVLLLVGGIAPLESRDSIKFIVYIGLYLVLNGLMRVILTSGAPGTEKSESGSMAFETIFRYTTIKGFFIALFMGDSVKFKVTEKDKGAMQEAKKINLRDSKNDEENQLSEELDKKWNINLEALAADGEEMHSTIRSSSLTSTEGTDELSSKKAEEEDKSSLTIPITQEDNGRGFKKRNNSTGDRAVRRIEIQRNLKRVWFNIVTAAVLIFSITWGILHPQSTIESEIVVVNGVRGMYEYENVLPLMMAFGFAASNLLPHILAIFLCFIPYLSGWMMSDLVHGRCDQYAVHPKTGKLFAPWSFISLLNIMRMVLIFGSMIALGVYSLTGNQGTFVSIPVG